jgi:DNA-directed RNA polymerase I, II, and III subunit RPABC2
MSYFDNQYGGQDPDDKFKEESDGSDDDDSVTSSDNEEDEVVAEVEDEDDEVEDVADEEDDEPEEDDEQDGGAGDSDPEEDDIDEETEKEEKKSKRTKKIPAKNVYKKPSDLIDDEEEDEDNEGEQYLQKFDKSVNDNYLLNFHPESVLQNYDEILVMTKVVRNADGIIVDKLHRTIPYLTKYEKARILGQRAKQINSGAYPFVKVPENVIDGYLIAELELKQKRIPFIIRRPLPNGGSEYWTIKDLEDVSF